MSTKAYHAKTGNIVNRKTLKRELRDWQRGGTDPRSKMTSYEARSMFRQLGWALNVHA